MLEKIKFKSEKSIGRKFVVCHFARKGSEKAAIGLDDV